MTTTPRQDGTNTAIAVNASNAIKWATVALPYLRDLRTPEYLRRTKPPGGHVRNALAPTGPAGLHGLAIPVGRASLYSETQGPSSCSTKCAWGGMPAAPYAHTRPEPPAQASPAGLGHHAQTS